jgi:hypothetical protein
MEEDYNVVACRPVAGQQPSLSNSFKNKHVSTATVGYNNNGNPNRHERNNGTATQEQCFLDSLCQDVMSRADRVS